MVGPLENNVYLVSDRGSRKAALIDPGLESEGILQHLEQAGLQLELIINTHGHFDHIYANAFFKAKTGAKVLIHKKDLSGLRRLQDEALLFGLRAAPSPEPDRLLQEGDLIELAGFSFQVLHTPGHTPGGICLYHDGMVFVGDTLFAGSIGRTDLPGGSYEALIASVQKKLFVLPEETVVYPGHGPETTIGEEKRTNPFFN
ncbi:MAG: MBL fold metallo-hydrolase [candidate division NC10 bacterium]|nr:MBL fold metallo-hydrolase [candidate division NC10 bacterium]